MSGPYDASVQPDAHSAGARREAPVERLARRLVRLGRRLTAGQRALPDYLILGAQRAGTTSLYHYLTEHPAVLPAPVKEIHFFDHRFHRGVGWYRSHFPLLRWLRAEAARRGHRLVVGEASPYYLFHPAVPERVARVLPSARLIVLLRNPIDRAYSHYQHERRLGRETLSFEAAIEREAERLRGEEARLLRDPRYRSDAHRFHSYLARGRYAEQLERWFAHFPREQLLVIRSEDLAASPQSELEAVRQFLDLPVVADWPPASPTHHHRASYPPMPPELRARLCDYFAPYNAHLAALCGRDFGWDR